jgi:hypothetical protein
MVPCGVLVACGDAVSGYHRPVKHFVGVEEGGKCRPEIACIEVCVMEETLGYVHAHIYDPGQIRILRRLFKSIALFEDLNLIGLPFIFGTAAGQIHSQFQSGFTERGLIEVFLEAFFGFDAEHHVIGI